MKKKITKLLFVEKDSIFINHIEELLYDMGILIIPYRQDARTPELMDLEEKHK